MGYKDQPPLYISNYVYYSVIEKLGVEANTIRHGVEGLMHLMIESSKLMV